MVTDLGVVRVVELGVWMREVARGEDGAMVGGAAVGSMALVRFVAVLCLVPGGLCACRDGGGPSQVVDPNTPATSPSTSSARSADSGSAGYDAPGFQPVPCTGTVNGQPCPAPCDGTYLSCERPAYCAQYGGRVEGTLRGYFCVTDETACKYLACPAGSVCGIAESFPPIPRCAVLAPPGDAIAPPGGAGSP